MKIDLEDEVKAVQLKYRVDSKVKDELDELAVECKRLQISFQRALTKGLREVAKALRDAIEEKTKAKAVVKSEPKVEPRIEPKVVLSNGKSQELS
ncbi:MAG TPA: hypothetical protein VJ728_00835 [Candidatus Binataceae bacterium]|nr:hypothetical protein [Candidatus Binataceae bacterium]